jgi:hypothetical protein
MESPEPSERLQSYLDRRLSPDEEQALEERLKSDPLLADWLLLLATEEAVLKGWAGTANVARSGDLDEPWPLAPRHIPRASPNPPPPAPPKTQSLRRRLLIAGGALILLVGLGAFGVWKSGLWDFLVPPPPAPYNMVPIALLEDVFGDVQVTNYPGEVYPARVDQNLSFYEKVTTGSPLGSATMRYPDDTVVELGPDSTIQLDDPKKFNGKHFWVETGYLRLDVLKQPPDQPFIVSTPLAEITVQAARFTCACTPQTTRVEVDDGHVEIVRLVNEKPVAGERPVRVERGQYAVSGKEAEALSAHKLRGLQLFKPRIVISNKTGPLMSVKYSYDGTALASGGWDGVVTIWGPRTGAKESPLKLERKDPPPVRALAFFPDKDNRLAAGGDKEVHIWHLGREQQDPGLPAEPAAVDELAIAANGKHLATAVVVGEKNATIKLWPWPPAANPPEIREHSATPPPLAFSPDSLSLAGGLQDGRVKVWEVASRNKQAGFTAHDAAVLAIQFNPRGDLLATGGKDRDAKIWRWKDAKLEQTLTGHGRDVLSLAFRPDNKLLATGAADGTARLWEVGTGQLIATYKHGGYAVNSVCFSPDGKTLATAGWDVPVKDQTPRPGAIKLWDVPEIPPE